MFICLVSNHTIQDLLNARNRDLVVVEDEVHGVHVGGTTVRRPKNAAELHEVLRIGLDARSDTMSAFGPAGNYCSLVLQIDLTQAEGDPSSPEGRIYVCSRMMFVDVAGTEKLAEDAATLVAKEGGTLNKSILNLSNVATALGDAKVLIIYYYRFQFVKIHFIHSLLVF